MTIYSFVFNTMCIYFMVTTAGLAKASGRTWFFLAACFSFVFLANVALLDFEFAEAAIRAAAVGTIYVLIYWILIRLAKQNV